MSTPTSATAAAAAAAHPTVTAPVMRSLYRQLLTEAKKIDNSPVAKVMFPVPKKLSAALALRNQLYVPNTRQYSQLVRSTFRGGTKAHSANAAAPGVVSRGVASNTTESTTTAADAASTSTTTTTSSPKQQFDLNLAFDTLNRFKKHSAVMEEAMPRITKESSKLTRAFELVDNHLPLNKDLYVAKPMDTQAEAKAQQQAPQTLSSVPPESSAAGSAQMGEKRNKKKRRIGGMEGLGPRPPSRASSKAEPAAPAADRDPGSVAGSETVTKAADDFDTAVPKGADSAEDILKNMAARGHGAAKTATMSSSPSPPHTADRMLDLPASVESIFAASDKALVRHDPTAFIQPGLALIAHPLSSAHVDRRVMLVTEKTPTVTTGLVLDMAYNYPLSYGNPMFPEVMWGHEVMNGGYCHVDFTMPPTANVAILHTLAPPKKQQQAGGSSGGESQFDKWFAWAKEMKVDTDQPEKHHELLCKPVIIGDPTKNIPTLYYSKVEALPYLATLCPGEPKDSLRVYWGCMKWNTTQLGVEIESGHWIPTTLSPNFFSAYAVRPATGGSLDPFSSSLSSDEKRRSPIKKTVKNPAANPLSAPSKENAAEEEETTTTHEVVLEEKATSTTATTKAAACTETTAACEKVENAMTNENEGKKVFSVESLIKKDVDETPLTPSSDSALPSNTTVVEEAEEKAAAKKEKKEEEEDISTALTLPWDRDSPTRGERFPTTEQLQAAKTKREKLLGVDVAQPQVFPPDQPLCRREALWDQILYSMGGEYKALVGCANPFSQADRGPGGANSGLTGAIPNDMVQRLLSELKTRDDDDDDDDE